MQRDADSLHHAMPPSLSTKSKRAMDDFQIIFTKFTPYNTTRSFLVNSSASFLYELFGDDRYTFVGTYLDLISTFNLNFNLTDEFLYQVMILLSNQTSTNPPQYVSHGTDHAVRVMNWCFDLYSVNQLSFGMSQTLGTNEPQSKFILGTMGLLHDAGYADVDSHSVPKWLHAFSSGKLAEILFNSTAGRNMIAGIAGNNTDTVIQGIIRAISVHNFDENFCIWKNNNPTYASTCQFTLTGDPNVPSSSATVLLGTNVTYTREYTVGNAIRSPLIFALRVADNLDAIRTRLTIEQNNSTLMKFFLRLYQDAELRNAAASNSPLYKNQILPAAINRASNFSGLSNPTGNFKLVMSKATEQSWLHFYSNWIIQNATFDTDIWTAKINLWQANFPLNFEDHVGAGLFQLNRLASASLSLYLDDNLPFVEVLRLNLNIPINGLKSGNFLPLKSFTKKPIYNENGIDKWSDNTPKRVCDPYCSFLTKTLTASIEQCLDINDTIVECDYSGFSKIPPFDSLDYDSLIVPIVDNVTSSEILSSSSFFLIPSLLSLALL
eukprot:TRINITY_DN3270_c0_g1_i2.p1 TRINITY_DN3270_c0_g1~~TRINITY_DN3270_c0_g1_i2.p1  ORF type:complete len:626 (-),score=108.45 TRINITY_DN3270_c0_g1_i2:29-1678(-)